MLYLMKDGEIPERPLPIGALGNYCGYLAPTSAIITQFPFMYLPSIISVNGFYIIACNSVSTVTGLETDIVLNIAVYNNIGTIINNYRTVIPSAATSTSYYIAKSASTSKQTTSFTHFFMNGKID